MNRLALFLILALSCGCSWALSDFQKFNHLHPETREVSPLELFASPLQPGGKGLTVNWMNVLRAVAPKIAKKIDKGRSLVEMYTDNLVETDPEIVAFRNDDRPMKDWKKKLKAMKEEKRKHYFEYVTRMALGFKH